MADFPAEIQDFANLFVQMQEKRHRADYDPHESFYKSAVLADIEAARIAITGFRSVSLKHKRAFSAHIIVKVRKD